MDYKDNFVIVNDHHNNNQNLNDHQNISPKYYHHQSPSPAQRNRYQPFPSRQTSSHKLINRPQSATSQRSHSYSSLYNFEMNISPIKQAGIPSPADRRINNTQQSSRRSSKSSSSNNSGSNTHTSSARRHRTKIKSKSKTKHRQKHKHKHRTGAGSSHSLSSKRSSRSVKFNYADYEVLDTVGSGSFAKVSRVRRKTTSEIFVWKELNYGAMSDKEKQMLCDEVNILRDLNHPNIVQFVDRIIDHENRKIFIVQEYCDGGDLASYIKLKKDKQNDEANGYGRISESFIWSVTSEIASALQHCHNHFNRHNKKVSVCFEYFDV